MLNIRRQILSTIIAEAQERASLHRQKGERNVFIAQVATSEFEPYCLSIQFLKDRIDINGWFHPETKTLFFSMQEIGIKFSIAFRFIQRSEWLALTSIPQEIITRTIV